jgi:AI-2 transport protein TqsA
LPVVFGPLRAAVWLALFLMAGYLLHAGRNVLIPLALAVLIWQLINAISARLQRLRVRGRALRRWQRQSLGILLIVLALWLVVNLIARNVGVVSANAPVYEANLLALLPRIAALVGLPPPQSVSELVGQIHLDVWIRSVSAALAGFASSTGLVALYVAFMLVEQETFDRKVDALFPAPDKAVSVRAVFQEIERRIERYLWIKTLMSAATAALSWCVLAAVGCQNAGFWALVIFMLNYIPFIGSLLGVLFPALLTLVQFGSFGPFLAAVIGLALVQFSLGNVLEPRLMGSSLNLSPIVIMVSLAVWGSLWGVAGMFLCVPIMVIIMIICAHFPTTRPLAVLLSATGQLDKDVPGPSRPGRPIPAPGVLAAVPGHARPPQPSETT